MNPTHATIVETLRSRASQHPERRLFTFLQNGETVSDTLTYGALDRDARATAAFLQARVHQGDRLLLMYPPGLDFVRALMGCLYAGVVAVPVYPPRRNRTVERLRAIAEDAEAAGALAPAAVERSMGRDGASGLRVPVFVAERGTDAEPDAWHAPDIRPDTLAFLQYTSGSTGRPKGVMVSHGSLQHNVQMIEAGFAVTAQSVFVSWLPLFHDMGLIGKVFAPMFAGASSVLMEPAAFLQKPVRWLQAVSSYGGTISVAPNAAFELCTRRVTAADRATLDLSRWEFAANGAEPVRASTVRRFQEMFAECGLRPEAMQPCYGMAEATLLVSINGKGRPPVIDETGDRPLVSSGRTWLDQAIRIVEPDRLEPCADGAVGEIWISSPSVSAGYWRNPVATAAAFGARLAPTGEGPFLRTGDLGYMQGAQLFVTGRLKDLIIVRGRNHYPQDIEHTADTAHPALRPDQATAFAIDVDEEERLVVVCEVGREGLARLDAGATIAAVRQAITDEHEVDPDAIVLIRPSTLPRTTSGKVQRGACRQQYLDGALTVVAEWRRAAAAKVAAGAVEVSSRTRDAIRAWLVDRVSAHATLPADRVDVSAPFAQFGLDSARAVMLSGELQDWLGRDVPPTIAYDYPSIESMARHLAGAGPGGERVAGREGVDEPIAIIGLACRFPGASTPEAFWDLLAAGRSAIGPVSPARQRAAAFGEGGYLDDVDLFDASFFGVTPREAEVMDPQQRLLLETAWEALERAGIVPDELAGTSTGVFVGISSFDYAQVRAHGASATDPYAATGNAFSIAANRISYLLDLRGPSWAVDTACSSSLVAVHQASESLRRGESDLALCGGVNLILDPDITAVFTRAGMMSPSHRCRTFDAAADGYVRGEGVAILVLKRLSEAERDGDTIWAVVRGSAVNQDGRTNGLTAPNGPAQQAVVGAALRRAGVAPADVSLVEAHGTGTPLGDPIELNALREVLAEGRDAAQPCWVGSVKTNVGHLEAAAGVAGLTKAVLALRHRTIPPHAGFERLNPHISLGRTLAIPESSQAWTAPEGRKRIAGVSAFGFGGTNVHVVLEEAPHQAIASDDGQPRVLSLSARSASALAVLAARTAAFLRAHPDTPWTAVAATANAGRTGWPVRLAVVARASDDAATELEQAAAGRISGAIVGDAGSLPDGLRAAASAFVGGGAVDWRALDGHAPYTRVALPTYPFERSRFWVDGPERESGGDVAAPHPVLGQRLPAAAQAPSTHAWEKVVSRDALSSLSEHQVQGMAVLPYAVFVELALAAAAEAGGDAARHLADLSLQAPVFVTAGTPIALQVVADDQAGSGWRVRIYGRTAGAWSLAAAATVRSPQDRLN